jgi:soluble lytic murein transglycosylase-like protein
MQMTAQTAASYGVSVSQLMSDSSAAIWASARLLRDLLSRNGGDFVAALAAYNTGKAVCTGSGGFGYGAAPEYLMKAVTYSNTAITSGLVQKAPSSGAAGVLLSAAAVFAVGFFSVIRRG